MARLTNPYPIQDGSVYNGVWQRVSTSTSKNGGLGQRTSLSALRKLGDGGSNILTYGKRSRIVIAQAMLTGSGFVMPRENVNVACKIPKAKKDEGLPSRNVLGRNRKPSQGELDRVYAKYARPIVTALFSTTATGRDLSVAGYATDATRCLG